MWAPTLGSTPVTTGIWRPAISHHGHRTSVEVLGHLPVTRLGIRLLLVLLVCRLTLVLCPVQEEVDCLALALSVPVEYRLINQSIQATIRIRCFSQAVMLQSRPTQLVQPLIRPSWTLCPGCLPRGLCLTSPVRAPKSLPAAAWSVVLPGRQRLFACLRRITWNDWLWRIRF